MKMGQMDNDNRMYWRRDELMMTTGRVHDDEGTSSWWQKDNWRVDEFENEERRTWLDDDEGTNWRWQRDKSTITMGWVDDDEGTMILYCDHVDCDGHDCNCSRSWSLWLQWCSVAMVLEHNGARSRWCYITMVHYGKPAACMGRALTTPLTHCQC
jgi:hypothetical protein